jgi:hypothetical protein
MSLIGLSRSTRQILGLPDYLPVPRVDVASQAWYLAGLSQAGSLELDLHDDAAVDFVVGIVEAVEDFIVRATDAGRWPADLDLRAEAEAVGWVDDFLADGSAAPPGFAAAGDVPSEVVLFTLARQLGRALSEALRSATGR